MMTVRPPRVMFAVPVMALRRDTLLPESLKKVNDALEERVGNSMIEGNSNRSHFGNYSAQLYEASI